MSFISYLPKACELSIMTSDVMMTDTFILGWFETIIIVRKIKIDFGIDVQLHVDRWLVSSTGIVALCTTRRLYTENKMFSFVILGIKQSSNKVDFLHI